MVAATAVPFLGTAVMATDHQIVDWAHGRQASADDANAILCHRLYSGVGISPWE